MVIFETSRLIIREYKKQDFPFILEIYKDKNNMRFIPSGKNNWNRKKLKNKLNLFNQNYPKGYGIFMVELKDNNRVIGEASLFNSFMNNKVLELGYILHHPYWGKGLGSEMLNGLIHYGFNTLNLNCLIARMYTKNMASYKTAEKCGMILMKTGFTQDHKKFREYHINNSNRTLVQ